MLKPKICALSIVSKNGTALQNRVRFGFVIAYRSDFWSDGNEFDLNSRH